MINRLTLDDIMNRKPKPGSEQERMVYPMTFTPKSGQGSVTMPRAILEGRTNGIDIPGQTVPGTLLGMVQGADRANDAMSEARGGGLRRLIDTGQTTGQAQAAMQMPTATSVFDPSKPTVGDAIRSMDLPAAARTMAFQNPSALMAAKGREAAGAMTMRDAYLTGQYQTSGGREQFGTREIMEPAGTDRYGRAMEEARTVRNTPEQWLAQQNKPELDRQAAEKAMLQSAVGAGTMTMEIDPRGNVVYKPAVQTPKYMTTGAGVFDPTTQSIVPGTAGAADRGPTQYTAFKAAQVMLDENTVGVWNPKGYYDANPLKLMKLLGTNPKNGQYEEYTVPNFNTDGLPAYSDTPAAKEQKQSADTQDQQALEWARANPTDPRAIKIMERLGAK